MKRYRCHKRRFYVTLLGSAFIAFSLHWLIFGCNDSVDHTIYPNQNITKELVQKLFREIIVQEKNTGCEMPHLDPYSDEIRQFEDDVDAVVCDGVDWVQCYLSECFVSVKIQKEMTDLVCTYEDIIYVNDDYYYLSAPIKVNGNDKYYMLNRSDHVKVSCTGTAVNSLGLFKSRWSGFKAGYRPVKLSATPPAQSPNVLMILLDSISRNHFMRRMRSSFSVLMEELNAVVMKSYNIVEDPSAGALMPILTGHEELEVTDSRRSPNNTKRVDLKPFIFTLLKEQGYRTAFYENMPWVSTFNYRFNGFNQSPADHYLRPMYQEESKCQQRPWWGSVKRYCFGSVSQLYFQLNYISQMLQLDGKKFGVSFSALHSQEDINRMLMGDEELTQFLRQFKDDGSVEDTVLFVMGDHGPSFDEFRKIYQGKIEERLPLLSIVLPEKLKRQRPHAFKNLMANSEVLTTPFDVHTTLLDILGLKEHRNKYKVPGSDLERGLSFLEPIPKSRSCAEAGVLPHWCACVKWHNVSSDDYMYIKVAEELAKFINEFSDEKRSVCATRKLVSVEWVMRQSPKPEMLGLQAFELIHRYIGRYEPASVPRAEIEYYQTRIIMDPEKAIYEAKLKYIVKYRLFEISGRDIIRINAYGDQASCVSNTHPRLNKYCYCISKIMKN